MHFVFNNCDIGIWASYVANCIAVNHRRWQSAYFYCWCFNTGGTIMNLPTLLQQLESGSISAAQAEQEIRDEIERVRNESFHLVWRSAFRELKIAFELETKPHKHEQTS